MLLRDDGRAPDRRPDPVDAPDDVRRGERGIRCPKCKWRPRATDLWGCLCGCAFHTFDTAGRCPGCGEQWDHTQCLSCHAWSPHPEWYER